MQVTAKRLLKLAPLLAAWPLLQSGCVGDAVRFELLNLVTNEVFTAAQTIFDNFINFG